MQWRWSRSCYRLRGGWSNDGTNPGAAAGNLLRRTIRDKRLLGLIGRYLRAGVLVGGHIEPSEVGTPQGGPLSPLLANILLHQLDCELERRGHRFARYADDMIVLVKSQRAAERVMRSITRYLEGTLKLKVNPAKSKAAPMSECSFLGFTIKGKKIRWTTSRWRPSSTGSRS